MSKEEVIKIVEEYLDKMGKECGDELGIIMEATREKRDFYVFCYDTKRWIETKNFSDAIVDNYPLIVRKSDGKIFETSYKYHLDDYIEYFERYGELKTSGPAWWEDDSKV